MAKSISISLVGIVDEIPTKLNHFFNDEEKTTCTFYGTCNMSSSEIRAQISELALFLSDQGFFCTYDGGDTLEASIAPPDTANMPSSKEEPTFALIARVFSYFTVTSSNDGYIFLINKNGLSPSKMRKFAAELEGRRLNAEYNEGNNFIAVTATDELETFFTSIEPNTEEKNISSSIIADSASVEEVVS